MLSPPWDCHKPSPVLYCLSGALHVTRHHISFGGFFRPLTVLRRLIMQQGQCESLVQGASPVVLTHGGSDSFRDVRLTQSREARALPTSSTILKSYSHHCLCSHPGSPKSPIIDHGEGWGFEPQARAVGCQLGCKRRTERW